MGIDFDSLKNVANGDNVDQAAEFAKSHFGDHADTIDAAAAKAKHFLNDDLNGEQPTGGGGENTVADDYGRHAINSADCPQGDHDDHHSVDEHVGDSTPGDSRHTDMPTGGYAENSDDSGNPEHGYGG
ncbi:hypothetical protein [Amycolatopsis sp. RTGN1]|uniref:hypothetical protein n=1 Tax=Amycolatopsis ponsaeliensis TaxID=2992142 RepID=UPI003307BF08